MAITSHDLPEGLGPNGVNRPQAINCINLVSADQNKAGQRLFVQGRSCSIYRPILTVQSDVHRAIDRNYGFGRNDLLAQHALYRLGGAGAWSPAQNFRDGADAKPFGTLKCRQRSKPLTDGRFHVFRMAVSQYCHNQISDN
ncbi:hypothetical protein [Sphingomonas paucimobilis]|uniref:hypothetical protein n=1 Tax=Sphingomonas paucimobilis TaxID=13689 RepID=UPI003B968610